MVYKVLSNEYKNLTKLIIKKLAGKVGSIFLQKGSYIGSFFGSLRSLLQHISGLQIAPDIIASLQ